MDKDARHLSWDLGETHRMTFGLITRRHGGEGRKGERAAFLPENDALQVEGVLYDSCGGDAHPEHILLSGEIVGICNAIQIGKITTGRPARGEQEEKERDRKTVISSVRGNRCSPLPFQEVWRNPVEKASERASQRARRGPASAAARPALCPNAPSPAGWEAYFQWWPPPTTTWWSGAGG